MKHFLISLLQLGLSWGHFADASTANFLAGDPSGVPSYETLRHSPTGFQFVLVPTATKVSIIVFLNMSAMGFSVTRLQRRNQSW
jgi:hypothetical protein